MNSTPRASENLLTCASSTNTSLDSVDNNITTSTKDFYREARDKLDKVEEIKKKMINLTKARLSSFKQK